jgi:vancomycin resistance protein YoaR
MKWKKIILITLPVVLLGLPLAVGSAFYLAYRNKVFPQTYLGPWNVSGLTKPQAVDLLDKKISIPKNLTFQYQDKNYSLATNGLGLDYQLEKSVDQAYQDSRSQFIANGLKKKFTPLSYSLDETRLETKLATVAAQINQPTIPNQILLNEKNKIEVKKGKPGKELNVEQTKKEFLSHVQTYQLKQPINLIVDEENNLPSDKQIKQTKQRAENLISKTLTLSSKQQNFVIEQDQLINFVGFKQDWDDEKIKEYVQVLSQSIDQQPESALFEFQNGKVTTFKPHQNGYQLDQPKAIETIKQGLSELTNGRNSLVKQLSVNATEPKIKTSNTNRFGITSLIGQGESTFFGSITSRVHNIDLASSKLHGILVAPGETFSLAEALGEISTATGYKQAYIIQDGQTILGAGGGVCQVSTTLFRTVINSGLEVVERHPHAYRVGYYEQDKPVGFDAAVFVPTTDFKFKNDTNNYILIQREFNNPNRYLSFKFYGTDDGRKISISNERMWDQVSPPEPLYIDDPSLPPGQTKQIDHAAWGAKAAFDWKVTKNDKVIHERTFFSHYQAWQAKYLRGVEN